MTGDTAMDAEALDRIAAAAGGENHIIGLVFDNGGRKVIFGAGKKLSDYYLDEHRDVLVFHEKDICGVPFTVYHAVTTVQAVITLDNLDDAKKLNVRYAMN